jgi:microcystin-dependent protein
MATSFIGEIRMFGGNFPPQGWAFCNGQILAIAENDALFALIGTTFGGDGVQTFGLPDLRGRIPVHQGSNLGSTFVIGQVSGTETVTLTSNQIAGHSHTVAAATSATVANPSGAVYGGNTDAIYSTAAPSAPMNAAMVTSGGGGQPHDNMMPFGVVNFIISLFGVFPSRN